MKLNKENKTKVETLIRELISIGTKVDVEPFTNPNATSGFLSECRDRARTIGEQLYILGGKTTHFMYIAHSRVGIALGRVAAWELDACWNGIGSGQPGITAWVW